MADVRLYVCSVSGSSSGSGSSGSNSGSNSGSGVITHIYGNADSRVARGLLALLISSLTTTTITTSGSSDSSSGSSSNGSGNSSSSSSMIVTINDILNLNPNTIGSSIGLNTVLPQGRLDGLRGMLVLIQEQLQLQLSQPVLQLQLQQEPPLQPLLQPLQPQLPLSWSNRSSEVAVLLSGGVDSSVALALLVEAGVKVSDV